MKMNGLNRKTYWHQESVCGSLLSVIAPMHSGIQHILGCLPDVASCWPFSHDLYVRFYWFQLLVSSVNAFQQLFRTSLRINFTTYAIISHLLYLLPISETWFMTDFWDHIFYSFLKNFIVIQLQLSLASPKQFMLTNSQY